MNFRKGYKVLTADQKANLDRLKDLADQLGKHLDACVPDCPDTENAKKKLQECIFWASYATTA